MKVQSWRWPPRRCAGVLVLVVVMGCSGAGVKRVVSPKASPTTSTTTVAETEAVIVAQWRAAENASVAAAKDPSNPALLTLLADYMVDPALSFQRNEDTSYARDGLTNVGEIDNGTPRVVSMSVSTAVVSSCTTNRLALIYTATGKPFPGSAGNPAPIQNGVRSTMIVSPSGTWKLSSSVFQQGSCVGF